MYDYLVVGAGLFGAVFAHEMHKKNKKVLIIDKRSHIGGNCYTENIEGIEVHKYGPHIFHTNNKTVWDYVNKFAEFNRFTNMPIANYNGELYNLPFNMNTFYQMWGVKTPCEAKAVIDEQVKASGMVEPKNLEEQAIKLVGRDIYEKLVKGYTEKQWGRKAVDLPSFIIKRLPLRFTFDNNYFNDRYQGIPIGGYTQIFKNLLDGIEIKLNTDFIKERKGLSKLAKTVVYTGMIDEYYDYCYGELDYRSLKFETKLLDQQNFQGNAVVNYTDAKTPYTRIVEHKHFDFGSQDKTVVTYEYPKTWQKGDEPYYSVNDDKNNLLFEKYRELSEKDTTVLFGGRLGHYKYYDMDKVIESVLYLTKL